ILRADDRLRLHAGDRHRERPSRGVPPAREAREVMTARRSTSSRAPRAWQRMLSGRRLDLLDPSPLDVEIEDIAHGLARVARWNGQTKAPHFFWGAHHPPLAEAFPRKKGPNPARGGRLGGLMPDAPKYVMGD